MGKSAAVRQAEYRARHSGNPAFVLKIKKQRKDYYAENKNFVLRRRREYGLSKHGKFLNYRQNAKSRGLEFYLTEDEFLSFWQKPCHYCGDIVPTIGLDRVDNRVGYTMANIVSCHEACNKMKLAMGYDEFIGVCRKIASRFP